MKSIIYELLWFIQGTTNNHWLTERGEHLERMGGAKKVAVNLRTPMALMKPDHHNGGTIDQLAQVVDQLKTTPIHAASLSRRGTSPTSRTWLCHCVIAFFQFYVANGELSCQLYQRSADIFLGVYRSTSPLRPVYVHAGTAMRIVAKEFIWTGGDCHLYSNHFEQVQTQLARRTFAFVSASNQAQTRFDFDYEFDDFEIVNYQSHAPIRAQVAVKTKRLNYMQLYKKPQSLRLFSIIKYVMKTLWAGKYSRIKTP